MKIKYQLLLLTYLFLLCVTFSSIAQETGLSEKYVPVGEYLYADLEKLPETKGSLRINLAKPMKNCVFIAYGRKNRKDRKSRDGTIEEEREHFKPRLGVLNSQGTEVIFEKLSADFYDIIIIDPNKMLLYEGVALQRNLGFEKSPAETQEQFKNEIEKSLGLSKDKIAGWEAFFDTKQFDRFEFSGENAAVLVQQMRLGKSFAESGDVIKGCIHSIDIVWLERAKVASAGWQVITRQQLYRDELKARKFFQRKFLKELQGIRVGNRLRRVESGEWRVASGEWRVESK